MVRLSKEIHPGLHRLTRFSRVMRGNNSMLPSADDFDGLTGGRGSGQLFLGYYDQAAIEQRLQSYGATDTLKHLGFDDLKVHLDTRNHNRQRLIICHKTLDYDHLLGELAMTVGEFIPQIISDAQLSGRTYSMLYIQWLCLQNPCKPFSSQRPALPGQRHPGLGLGRTVMNMFEKMAETLKLDGIINIPEYIHNAILYSRKFHFLNPVVEGRMQALMRDLGHMPLTQLSWGVEQGCVVEKDTGMKVEGMHEEQVYPRARAFKRYFKSPVYKNTVEQTTQSLTYIFDESCYLKRHPLNEDGTPVESPPPREEPLLD